MIPKIMKNKTIIMTILSTFGIAYISACSPILKPSALLINLNARSILNILNTYSLLAIGLIDTTESTMIMKSIRFQGFFR